MEDMADVRNGADIIYPHQVNPDVITPEEEAAYAALSDRIHAGERAEEFEAMVRWVLDNLPEGYHEENGDIVRDDPSLPLVPYLGEYKPEEQSSG